MTPFDYSINHVSIIINRGSKEPVVYDISRIFAEFNLYESLTIPYITGNIVVADSDAVSSLVNFNGTEKLVISFQVGKHSVQREFFITGMSNYSKMSDSDGAAVYILNFVESKAFMSNFRRLRGALTGEISNNIAQLYSSYFKEDIKDIESTLNDIQVVIPNLTPIEAAIWLANRATNEFGEPFFLYSSIGEGNHFVSLGTLMNRPLMTERPFSYSAAMQTVKSFEGQAHNIMSFNMPYPEDLTQIAKAGGVKTQYLSIDLLTKTVTDMSFDVSKHHDNKVSNNRVGANTNLLFDRTFMLDETDTIMDRETAFVTSVNTNKLFNDKPSYASEEIPNRHLLKMGRNSDLLFMEKQKLVISVAGYMFMKDEGFNSSIGKKIYVQIPKDKPTYSEQDINKLIDKKNSGEYVITHAKHQFNALRKYTVSLGLGRSSGPDQLNNSEEAPS